MNQKDIETLAIALPEDILKAKWCGDFDRAFHLIDLYLANEKVPAFMKTRLALEREVLESTADGLHIQRRRRFGVRAEGNSGFHEGRA